MSLEARAANPPKVRSLGDLLDLTFRRYRTDFSFLISAAASILLPFLLLSSVSTYHSAKNLSDLLTRLTQGGRLADLTFDSATANLGNLWVSGLTVGISMLLVNPLLYGVILHRTAVHELSGEAVPLGRCVAHAFRRLVPVWLTNLFAAVMWWVVLSACWAAAIAAVAAVSAVRAPSALVIGLGVVLFGGAACFTVWWSVRFAMVSSVTREERRILWRSVARSWALTRRNFWRTFGYFVLVYMMTGMMQSGLGVAAAMSQVPVLTVVVDGLSGLFVTPLTMLAVAYLYVDLRVRADGLDLSAWLGTHNPNAGGSEGGGEA